VRDELISRSHLEVNLEMCVVSKQNFKHPVNPGGKMAHISTKEITSYLNGCEGFAISLEISGK
jgi:hypothetical protein